MHQPLFVLFYNISNQIPSSTTTFKVIILYIYTMPHLIVVGSYAPLCPIVIDFLRQIKGGVGILRVPSRFMRKIICRLRLSEVSRQ